MGDSADVLKGNLNLPDATEEGTSPCPAIGDGWTQTVVPHKTKGSDRYFYSPEGKKFRSMVQVHRHLRDSRTKKTTGGSADAPMGNLQVPGRGKEATDAATRREESAGESLRAKVAEEEEEKEEEDGNTRADKASGADGQTGRGASSEESRAPPAAPISYSVHYYYFGPE